MKAAVRLRLLIFLVIGAIAVVQAGVKYAGLAEIIRPTTFAVDVQLAESGGLFDRAEVTFRGVTVGRVKDLEFQRRGVTAHLAIGKQWKIPNDLVAEVHNRSAVGEQYLDLVPKHDGGPFLAAGDQINADKTVLPVSDQELLLTLDSFLKSINTKDLQTVVHELGDAFEGSALDLSTLIDGGSTILARATESFAETRTLLQTGEVVLARQDRQASVIASYLDNLAQLSGVLRTQDGDLRVILRDGSRAAGQITLLLNHIEPQLKPLLVDLTSLSGIAYERTDGLEETLVALPYALASAQTPGRDGRAHFALDLSQDPAPCRVGYIPASQWRSPSDESTVPLNNKIGCKEPLSVVPRGSASVLGGQQQLNRSAIIGTPSGSRSWTTLLTLPLVAK